jgi:hypothetical protein
MVSVLEFNDWQFRIIDDAGEAIYDEPAAAAATNSSLVFGSAAQAQSRTHPQQFSNVYVGRLNAEPLPARLGPANNHADLIYHHLLNLSVSGDLAVSIPSHVSNQQLGLLLGIAKEANLAVTGFVDASLAHALDLPIDERAHVLDIELHRATLAEINVDGNTRQVGSSRVLEPLGAMGVVDGWLNVIADEFVQRTRFDPLHAAATEQQLLDLVSSWMAPERMGTPLRDQAVAVASGDQTRDIDISADVLQRKLEQRLDAVDLTGVRQLVITPRVQRIPGLAPMLAERVSDVIAANDSDYRRTLLMLSERLDHSRVERMTRATATVQHPAPHVAPTVAPIATHLLNDGHAKAFAAPEFARFFDADGKALAGVEINDAPGIGRPVHPGDRVVLGERAYLAIRVD